MNDKPIKQEQRSKNTWIICDKLTFENGTVNIISYNSSCHNPTFDDKGAIVPFGAPKNETMGMVELSEYLQYNSNLRPKYENEAKSINKELNYFSFFNEILKSFENEVYAYFYDGYVYIWDKNKKFQGAYIVYLGEKSFSYAVINPSEYIEYKRELWANEMKRKKRVLQDAQDFYNMPLRRLEGAKADIKAKEKQVQEQENEFKNKWSYLKNFNE